MSLLEIGERSELRITASIGVATYPLDASTASDLLERADSAMYHTKQTGRDGASYIGADRALTRVEPPQPGPDVSRARPAAAFLDDRG